MMMAPNPVGSRIERFRRNLGLLWEGLQNHDQDEQQMMILREAARAAMAWTVLYIFFFVLLLGYKWQTKSYYEAEYERKLTLMQVPVDNATEVPWWTLHETVVHEALSGVRDLGKLQDTEFKKMMQQQTLLQEMREKLDQLDFDLSSPAQESTNVVGIESLNSLLQRPALAEIPSSTVLDHLFSRALVELKEILLAPEARDWASLESQISADFPTKQPSVPDNGVVAECLTSKDEESKTHTSSIPPNAARQSDIEGRVKVLETYLERRNKVDQEISDLLLPDTLTSLERATQQRIHVTLEMIIAATTSGHARNKKSPASSCLMTDDVLEIVEGGLAALEQGADLRNVMRKKVMDLDPAATSIILDADLPPPTPKIPRRETTNLQRVLDTPLILQLVQQIDHLVEMVGGYNDRLDHWLDSVAGGRESVGEMVIRRLLEESGKVEIPSFESMAKHYLPPKAQAYLKRSNFLP